MQTHRALGMALVITSVIGWSMAGLFTRLLALDAPTILFWRGVFGAIGTLALIPLLPGPRNLRLGLPGLGYALVTAGSMLAFISALRFTSVAHVAVIIALVPLFAAFLALAIFREKPGTTAVIASLVAAAGVALMVGAGRDGNLIGNLLAAAAAGLMAGMILIARRAPHIPALAAMALASAISALATVPFATLGGIGLSDLALLAAFAVITQVIGFGLFALGARHLPATETALLTTLEAPFAIAWVWAVLGTAPATPTLIGGAIVLAAVIFYLRRPAPP
ncbi:MAG: DMT family transporter [Rhodobacteraceae bacterium]|nr:DMT family transporter [Paracoccaceae bacterium]